MSGESPDKRPDPRNLALMLGFLASPVIGFLATTMIRPRYWFALFTDIGPLITIIGVFLTGLVIGFGLPRGIEARHRLLAAAAGAGGGAFMFHVVAGQAAFLVAGDLASWSTLDLYIGDLAIIIFGTLGLFTAAGFGVRLAERFLSGERQ